MRISCITFHSSLDYSDYMLRRIVIIRELMGLCISHGIRRLDYKSVLFVYICTYIYGVCIFYI